MAPRYSGLHWLVQVQATTNEGLCEQCRAMDRQDALQMKTVEIVETFHNPCAPVNQYTCRCRTCDTRWSAIEVYDEDGARPAEWSWERELTAG